MEPGGCPPLFFSVVGVLICRPFERERKIKEGRTNRFFIEGRDLNAWNRLLSIQKGRGGDTHCRCAKMSVYDPFHWRGSLFSIQGWSNALWFTICVCLFVLIQHKWSDDYYSSFMQIRMRNFKELVPVWKTPFYQIPPTETWYGRPPKWLTTCVCVCVYVADKQKEEENDDLSK